MNPNRLVEKSDAHTPRRAAPPAQAEQLGPALESATEAYRRKGGKAHVAAALALIERAQRAINLAQEKLSPVLGFSEEWTDTGKLYDTIKHHWGAVNSRFDAMLRDGTGPRLDDFTVENERAQLAEKLSANANGQE